MGTMDMDSVPPATMTSAAPDRMRSAASAMACRPDEQKRLMVMAEVSTGRPARSEAMRATFMPCAMPEGEQGMNVGARGAQRAFVGAADGSANGGDDDGFGHDGLAGEDSVFIVGRVKGKSKRSKRDPWKGS